MKKAAGDKKDDLKISMKLDQLYVNNQLIRPAVVKPSLESLLAVDRDDLDKANKLPHALSPLIEERGSSFQAEAVRVRSLSEVRLAYEKVLVNPIAARASHNIIVYTTTQGKIGWLDDGEHGAGRYLANWMKDSKMENICIIITRVYGGQKLGGKRFELMKDAAKAACSELRKQLHLE